MILRRDALPERQWLVSSASLVRRRRPDRPAGHEFRRGFGLALVLLAMAHVRPFAKNSCRYSE